MKPTTDIRSFTLIELLIAIVIIGILIAIAIPQYQNLKGKIYAAEARNILRQLSDSVWRYHIETGQFPVKEDGNAIPSYLDIQAPPSKYFVYQYCGILQLPLSKATAGTVLAANNNYAPNNPSPLYYAIGFSKTLPQPDEIAVKMDDAYYRYFGLVVLGYTGTRIQVQTPRVYWRWK